MKLTQTDFKQQSLVMTPQTKFLIMEVIESMMQYQSGTTELRNEATALFEFLGNAKNEDSPTLFQKYRSLLKCQSCAGSGQQKHYPQDRNDDVVFLKCPICQGEGQLYIEIIRKGYIPTEVHRRKFAK